MLFALAYIFTAQMVRIIGHCILLILRRHSVLRKGQFVFCVD
jgi:hypothetical protein